MLLGLLSFGIIGLGFELFLLDHTEPGWQWLPLIALGAGLASAIAVALRPTRASVRTFQAVMLLLIVTGALGLYLHVEGNAEFEREMDATVGGLALFWRTLRGATPALAPGALMQLGILGVILAYGHPALRGRGTPS